MTQASRLRTLLRRDGMVVAPGAYDCITARLIEQARFAAVYMTGAGTAASLGYPDFGLVTMSEMVANARRIAAAVEVPIVADAGYGNELNVFRTAREFERSGAFRESTSRIRNSRRNAAISKAKRSSRRRITWQRSAPLSPPAATRTSPSSRAPMRAPSPASTRRSTARTPP